MKLKRDFDKTHRPLKVLHVVGARPNFMKVAPIMHEMSKYHRQFDQLLVHTGQHYDDNMSKIFFEDIDLPKPDIYLGVGSGSHAQQTAHIMLAFEPVLLEHHPDLITVVGDVNSTVACALTAVKLGIKVAHVEAGLRSFDHTMPEEYNRMLTDHISDLLFTTEDSANKNLRLEGVPEHKIYFVGNVMIDTLVRLLPKAKKRQVLSKLGLTIDKHKNDLAGEEIDDIKPSSKSTVDPIDYVLVTLHRPSNVDIPETLRDIMLALNDISRKVPVIFPVHPRTQKRIKDAGLEMQIDNLNILEPIGYLDFLALMQSATLVITDSGGIQEETTYLGIPCLTVRPNTERPITIEIGTNRLVASEKEPLKNAFRSVLNKECPTNDAVRPPLWDGQAAQRVVSKLASYAATIDAE